MLNKYQTTVRDSHGLSRIPKEHVAETYEQAARKRFGVDIWVDNGMVYKLQDGLNNTHGEILGWVSYLGPALVTVGESEWGRWQQIEGGPKLYEGCKLCETAYEYGGPRHEASFNCRSGRKPHCTCDTCF